MAKPKFLSEKGLAYLWGQLKTIFATKVDKEVGKGLSTNDYTDADKEKLDAVEANADVNVIESISVNGTEQQITSKNVDISVPTNVSELVNDANYATTTQLATKEDSLDYGTATSADIGKAMMPKTVESGRVISWEFGEAGRVDDIQIDSDSIVNNKVANIPYASYFRPGVIKVGDGLAMYNGLLNVDAAIAAADIKPGVGTKFVPTSAQDIGVFYGLAKAAGDSTQSASANSVGTYTEEAKAAIKTMLGFATSSDITTAISDAVSQITSFEFEVVNSLPASGSKGIIYLVAHAHGTNDGYDEYIWVSNAFEKIGNTDIDLSNYATTTYVDTELASKQDLLTFDNSPTSGSDNPVKSGGVYTALQGKQNTLTFDNTPTTGSNNPVTSNGIKSAFDGKLDKPNTTGNTGQILTADGQGGTSWANVPSEIDDTATIGDTDKTWSADKIATELADAGTVQDVQVNGTSVLDANGVAVIPVASTSSPGVAKANTQYGTNAANGEIRTNPASASEIKGHNTSYKPITPNQLHNAVFYGLARASGDTTQESSSNPVGTYTDSAKASIKAMLGIGGETQTVIVSGTAPTINAVANARYICGEVTSIDFTPSASGICDVIFTSGSTVAVLTLPSTVMLPDWFDATALEPDTTYEISIVDGVYGAVMVW